jgi:hypothetical protein
MPTQAQITNADEAFPYALDLLAAVADRYQWSDADYDDAAADVEAAYDDADAAAWFGADAETFWSSLLTYASEWTYPGADQLLEVYASAIATNVSSEEAYIDASDVYDAIEETVYDVGEISEAGQTAAKNPWAWYGLGAAALLGLGAYLVL